MWNILDKELPSVATDKASTDQFLYSLNFHVTEYSIYKRQTRPLVREGAPQKQDRNCQTVINIWSWVLDGARHQDLLTDWPSVAMWLWLWLWLPTESSQQEPDTESSRQEPDTESSRQQTDREFSAGDRRGKFSAEYWRVRLWAV
jgi:hypothetical protein